jgi:Dolichyl-phosphate-mannose-protein mannosyltransferase
MRRGFFPVVQIQVKPAVEMVVLSGMLVSHLLISLWLLSEKGLFIDDSMHIPAGYSYLLTHDYRLNQEHPPFIKLLSAAGLWRVHPRFPFDSPGWQQAAAPGDPEYGMERIEEAFFDTNAAQFEKISFWGRLPVIAVPLLLVLVVWWFGRQLFGPIAGLMAGFLLMTEPNILGNSIVVQNDVAAALALLLFVVALRRYLTGTGRATALMLGAALGFALIAKYSLLLLIPLSFLIVVVNGAVRVIRKHSSVISSAVSSCVVFVTAYLILLAAYAFHADRIDADESSVIDSWFYLSGNVAALSQKFLTWLPPSLPKYFVYGINMVVEDSREGRPAFLLGQVSNKGWWYYFPVAFVLKTTIPFLISSVLGISWAIVHLLKGKRNDLLYLVLPPLLYLALCMTSHLNIGVRHILPIFPFFAIAGAGVLSSVVDFRRKQTRAVAVSCVVILLLISGIIAPLTFPNYLTYFSPLAGGTSRGWTTLSDSNVETGQEVKTLAKYLKDRGENRVAGVMIGGEFLRFYGIQAYDLPGWEAEEGSDEQVINGNEDTDDESKEGDNKLTPENENTKADDQLIKDMSSTADSGPKYTAIGAWYMLQIGLSPRQRQVIDAYVNQTPEAMIGNSIFVFRRH